MHVVLTELPLRSDSETPAERPQTYSGANEATTGLLDALIARGDCRFVVHAPPGRQRELEAARRTYPEGAVELLRHADIRSRVGSRDAVIQIFRASLWPGIHLRWLCGSPRWPVAGITYGLASLQVYRDLLLSVVASPQPYDAIVCVSEAAREALRGHFRGLRRSLGVIESPQLPLVELGIDTRRFAPGDRARARAELGLPADSVVFLYLGRLSPTSKADLSPLLQALAGLGPSLNPTLVVAGSLDPGHHAALARLKLRATELGVAEQLRWFVSVDTRTRAALLQAADVFVSPVDSLTESFGLTLVEAMASGLPVVAADWNGYREIVEPGVTGMLVPTLMPEDVTGISASAPLEKDDWWWLELGQATVVDVGALTRALRTLALDPGLRARMGAAGHERARQRFDVSRAADDLLNEWQRLADEAGSPSAAPPPSPFWFDHGDVFSAHPTRRLGAGSLVQRATAADPSSSVLSAAPRFLDRSTLEEILERAGDPIRIGDLGDDGQQVTRHVAYLLKHGLLTYDDS